MYSGERSLVGNSVEEAESTETPPAGTSYEDYMQKTIREGLALNTKWTELTGWSVTR